MLWCWLGEQLWQFPICREREQQESKELKEFCPGNYGLLDGRAEVQGEPVQEIEVPNVLHEAPEAACPQRTRRIYSH